MSEFRRLATKVDQHIQQLAAQGVSEAHAIHAARSDDHVQLKVVAGSHDDYPAMVAEALDCVVAATLDMPTAAATLGVSPSQLVSLLEKEPAALGALNRLRGTAGLKPLR